MAQPGPDGAAAFLKQYARRRSREICELCGQEVASVHEHLLEIASRRLACSCEACALLFSGQAVMKFRRIPRRILVLPEFQLTDAQWNGLNIPINMAFFFTNSATQQAGVMYPSPAGATEALLPQEGWSEIAAANPVLATLQPDVEALLVNRVGRSRGGEAQYLVVPIDQCFRLVGLIRMHWKGFSGGNEVWREIGEFFSDLTRQARVISGSNHA